MNKETIILEKTRLIDWTSSLKQLSDDLWFKPFGDGKWGTADVISHFISWDQFLIDNRIPYLRSGKDFPPIIIDVEVINKKASAYARSGINKNALIDQFISIRKKLVSLLEKIPSETYDQPYPGKNSMSVSDYLVGMIDHDHNHVKQIEAHLDLFNQQK